MNESNVELTVQLLEVKSLAEIYVLEIQDPTRERPIMKYIVAVFSFLFSWLGVAFVVGIAVSLLFPRKDGNTLVGLVLDFRNLPGNILGILAGVHSARVSLRPAKCKE